MAYDHQMMQTPASLSPAQQLYASLPLPGGAIRVLDLDPRPACSWTLRRKKTAPPLTGHLRVVSLATGCPRFTTLSYVWGEYSSPRRDIIALHKNEGGSWSSQCSLEITRNCRDALLAVRDYHHRHRKGPISIWIDAICINQSDAQEKQTQIPLMGDIYSFSERTYIWLGEGTEQTDHALLWLWKASVGMYIGEMLEFVAAAQWWSRWAAGTRLAWRAATARFRTWIVWIGWWLWRSGSDWDRGDWWWVGFRLFFCFLSYPVPFFRHKFWPSRSARVSYGYDAEALDALFSRPWFRRAWTFQEYLLSYKSVFLCGRHFITNDELLASLQAMRPLFKSGRFSNKLSTTGYSKQARVPLSAYQMRDLAALWMNVDRPIQWNGRTLRRALPNSGTTASAYQEQVVPTSSSWTRGTFKLLYLGMTLLVFMPTSFVAIFLLGLLPAALNPLLDYSDGSYSYNFWPVMLASPVVVLDALFLLFIAWLAMENGDSSIEDLDLPGLRFTASTHVNRTKRLQSGRDENWPTEEGQKKTTSDLSVKDVAPILEAIRVRDATDAKDRSFAVHGVLSRLGGMVLSMPNYDQPRIGVYRDLLSDLICWQPSLVNLILEAGCTRALTPIGGEEGDDETEGPSWVPDWNVAARVQESNARGLYSPGRLRDPQKESATPGWMVHADIEGNTLWVSGVWAGDVAFLCGPFGSGDVTQDVATERDDVFWKGVRSIASWIWYTRCNATSSYESLPDVIRQALVGADDQQQGGVLADKGLSEEEARMDFDVMYRALSSIDTGVLVNSDMTDAAVVTESLKSHFELRPDGEWALCITAEYLRCCLAGRRTLFTTDRGFVGTGLPDTRVGDRVALIGGVSVPMLLRRCLAPVNNNDWDEYQVVGPAVVPGKMYGEGSYDGVDVEWIQLV